MQQKLFYSELNLTVPKTSYSEQGLKYLFLTLPNSDSGWAPPEVSMGNMENMEKYCAFTMA